MAPNSSEKLPVVTEAESALRSLGVRGAVLDQRPAGRGYWFADWSGPLAGSDVYLAVMGKGATTRKVRLVLDDWIIEDVATTHLGDVIKAVFSGRASIRRKRAYLVMPVQALRVTAGHSHYSAVKKLPPEGTPRARWEDTLVETAETAETAEKTDADPRDARGPGRDGNG